MSLENFISFLQQLLTMVDKKDAYSTALAKSILQSVVELAKASQKVDGRTLRAMDTAVGEFEELVLHAKEFAGKPGEILENEQKRSRLTMMLLPSC